MKKELIMKLSLSQTFILKVRNLGDNYARLLSLMMEENISRGDAFRITNAVISFTFLVFSYGHAIYSVIFLVWFICALTSCKRAGIR